MQVYFQVRYLRDLSIEAIQKIDRVRWEVQINEKLDHLEAILESVDKDSVGQ